MLRGLAGQHYRGFSVDHGLLVNTIVGLRYTHRVRSLVVTLDDVNTIVAFVLTWLAGRFWRQH